MPNRDPLEGLTRDSVQALVRELGPRTMAVPLTELEWRESKSGDGSRVLTGYASVFGVRTTLYNGRDYQMDEIIAPSAFDAVLAGSPDVHLNIGHDNNKSMARTTAPGPMSKLQLTADAHGLRVYARLNPENRAVQELTPMMNDGVMDQMSFAFQPGVETSVTETDAAGRQTDVFTIESVSDLYNTCVCARGAYPTTAAALRTLALSGAHVANREVGHSDDGAQDDPAVASDASGAQDDPAVASKRSTLIADGVVALASFKPREEV